ncbi:MAG: hypothetical protein NT169_22765 [Chloroflexi bacterium]|nr:hypothetical protein [Chloroflexota bacterium]
MENVTSLKNNSGYKVAFQIWMIVVIIGYLLWTLGIGVCWLETLSEHNRGVVKTTYFDPVSQQPTRVIMVSTELRLTGAMAALSLVAVVSACALIRSSRRAIFPFLGASIFLLGLLLIWSAGTSPAWIVLALLMVGTATLLIPGIRQEVFS